MSAAQPSPQTAPVDAKPVDVVQAGPEAPEVGPEVALHAPDVAAAAGGQAVGGAPVGGAEVPAPAPAPVATGARGRAKRSSWDKDRYMCEHKRRKYLCRDCGGSQICEHGKVRTTCKECQEDGQGGGTLCDHGRRRTFCKECGGNALCVHKRQKTTCKECGGSQVCPHNKMKSACKECKGGSICQHDRVRTLCKDCKGGGICSHGREKRKCKDCEKVREDANDTVERIFKNSWAQCPGITTADPLVLPGPGKPSDEEILQLEIALAVSEAIADRASDEVVTARTRLAAAKRRFQQNAQKESGEGIPAGISGVQAGAAKMGAGLVAVVGAAGDGTDMSVARDLTGAVGGAAIALDALGNHGLGNLPPPPPPAPAPLSGMEVQLGVVVGGADADAARMAKKRAMGAVAGVPGQPAPVTSQQLPK